MPALRSSVHVSCCVTLLAYSAQDDGYPISDVTTFEVLAGDWLGPAKSCLECRPKKGSTI